MAEHPAAADTTPAIKLPGGDEALPSVPGYKVLELVGRGGMGRVYRARDVRLGRVVAIKMLNAGADQHLVDRFLAEAKTVAQLQHPHIAQLLEFGTTEEQPYYVMEFAAGGSLAAVVAERPLQPRLAAETVEVLASAMDYAHRQGTIHRDLKPANILIKTALASELDVSALVIADFGLARQLAAESRLTQTGDILGTPSYMAPEQATGVVKSLGPATDIYALGAILYELLTGRPPFVGPDSMQTLMMLISDEPVAPRTLQPKLPIDLQTICLKCLEKLPARRYSTAQALADDLRRFLDGQPIVARPISVWERATKWTYRNPWKAAALGVMTAALIGALVGNVLLQTARQATLTANSQLQQANTDLTIAKRESDASFALTQESLAKIVDRVRDDLYNVPQAETVMLGTSRDAAALHRKLHNLRPSDIAVEKRLYTALTSLWLLEWNYGHYAESDAALQEAKRTIAHLRQSLPDDVWVLTQRVRLAAEEADLLARAGKQAESTRLHTLSLEESARLLEQYPNDADVLKLAVLQAGREITVAANQGDLPGALAAAKERTDLARRELQQATADTTDAVRLTLTQHLCALGDLLAVAKDAAGAQAAFAEAETLYAPLAKSGTEARTLAALHARIQQGLALVALFNQDYPTARSKLAIAAQQIRQSMQDFPQDLGYPKTLAGVLLDLARVDFMDSKAAEATAATVEAEGLIDTVLTALPGDSLALNLRDRATKTKAAIATLEQPPPEKQ